MLKYSRTESHETPSGDFLITKNAHIVEVLDSYGTITGYVATCSTLTRGCWGFDSSSQSFVYDANHYGSAEEWCESCFDTRRGEE